MREPKPCPRTTASTARLAHWPLFVGFFLSFQHIGELYKGGGSEKPLGAEEMIQMQSFWPS